MTGALKRRGRRASAVDVPLLDDTAGPSSCAAAFTSEARRTLRGLLGATPGPLTEPGGSDWPAPSPRATAVDACPGDGG